MTQRIGKHVLAPLAIATALSTQAYAANENSQAFIDATNRAIANSSSTGNFPELGIVTSSGSFSLTDDEYTYLTGSLTADAYVTYASSAIIADLGVATTPLDNLRENLSDGAGQGALPPALWVRGATGKQKLDDDNNAAQIRTNYDDSMFGGDIPLPGGWRIGGAFGYGQSDSKLKGRDAKADTDSKHYAVLGGRDLRVGGNLLILQFGGSYSTHRMDSERSITSPLLGGENSANYDLTTNQLFGEAAYHITFDKKGYVEPFFGLNRLNQRADSFTEKGSVQTAARVSGQDNTLISSTLGARARQLFQLGGRDLMLKGNVTWRHLQGDLEPEMTVKLTDIDAFKVQGTRLPKDTVSLQLKADYSITRQFILDVDYNGAVGSGLSAHEIALNAHWKM